MGSLLTLEEFQVLHERRMNRFARLHLPGIYEALHQHISSFAGLLVSHGPEAARLHMQSWFINDQIFGSLNDLYQQTVLHFATKTLRELKNPPLQVKAQGFGTNPQWTQRILDYLSTDNLSTVADITETTRRQILSALEQGVLRGWGLEKIASQMVSDDLTLMRARVITRTELAKAQSLGFRLASEDSLFETTKTWITARDHRVRHSHELMQGVTIDSSDLFRVPRPDGGFDLMYSPGDPNGSPSNVINCRCTMVTRSKRDAQGRLIRK